MSIAIESIVVMILEDGELLRQRLVELMRTVGGIGVIAEAADAPTAVALARLHAPQVVVLDIRVPGNSTLRNGLDVLREIKRFAPLTGAGLFKVVDLGTIISAPEVAVDVPAVVLIELDPFADIAVLPQAADVLTHLQRVEVVDQGVAHAQIDEIDLAQLSELLAEIPTALPLEEGRFHRWLDVAGDSRGDRGAVGAGGSIRSVPLGGWRLIVDH